jgi:hypothetical protein
MAAMVHKAPLVRLGVRFDAERLRAEALAFPGEQWRPDRFGVPGYWSLSLSSHRGGNNERQDPPFGPTPHLARCPAVRDVLLALGGSLAEVRLRRLERGATLPMHHDADYFQSRRLRVHVPLSTDPGCRFRCGETVVHMAEGEAWIFDRLAAHQALNEGTGDRIHLIIDTTDDDLPRRLAGLDAGAAPTSDGGPLRFEEGAPTAVLDPDRLSVFLDDLRARMEDAGRVDAPRADALVDRLAGFRRDWEAAWRRHGPASSGWPTFLALARGLRSDSQRVEREAGGVVSRLVPSISTRLRYFLRSGAFVPSLVGGEGAVPGQFELAEEVVLGLAPDGTLTRSIRRGWEEVEADVEELGLLAALAREGSPRLAAEAAGLTWKPDLAAYIDGLAADEVIVPRADPRWTVEEGVSGGPGAPGVAQRPPRVAAPPERGDSGDRGNLRLPGRLVLRMSPDGTLGVYSARERCYLTLSVPGARYLVQLARLGTPSSAANAARLVWDDRLGRVTGRLIEAGLVV